MEEDEDPNTTMEWNEISEFPTPPAEQGKVSLIWNKGWRIGKKVMITGVAITSAPILLPSLMVASAIGFAFAIPFGLVFASYACTDKIMAFLLKPPQEQYPLIQKQGREQEPEDEICEAEDVEEEGEKVGSEDEEVSESDEQKFAVDEEVTALEKAEEDNDLRGEEEERAITVAGDVAPAADPTVIHERKEPLAILRTDDAPALAEVSEEEIHKDDSEKHAPESDVSKEATEILLTDDFPTLAEASVEMSKDESVVYVSVSDLIEPQATLPSADYPAPEKVSTEIQDEPEQSQLSSEDYVTAIEGRSWDTVETEGGESVEQPVSSSARSTSEGETCQSPEESMLELRKEEQGKKKKRRKNKKGVRKQERTNINGMYSEEQIWQQIDAIRTIVGYKAAVQMSCIEELKALYNFTGVEPPPLFKDSFDLAEVNDKLHFLKSVVGVK